MTKKNNAKSAGGGNAAAKTEKKGKNQISQQQARANAARASAKISPAPEGPAPAISVLVPICNSEQYLEQALDSLIAQTFVDFVPGSSDCPYLPSAYTVLVFLCNDNGLRG